jgi:hypothetical protein
MNRYDTLGSVLGQFWENVRVLSTEDAKAVLNECALVCVRQDFQAKFLRELNSRRSITDRFFRRPIEFDTTAGFDAILGCKPASINARVVWGSFDDPIGFEVRGLAKSVHALFIDEGDAVGHLLAGRHTAWLFLAGASGALWKLRSRREQT